GLMSGLIRTTRLSAGAATPVPAPVTICAMNVAMFGGSSRIEVASLLISVISPGFDQTWNKGDDRPPAGAGGNMTEPVPMLSATISSGLIPTIRASVTPDRTGLLFPVIAPSQ